MKKSGTPLVVPIDESSFSGSTKMLKPVYSSVDLAASSLVPIEGYFQVMPLTAGRHQE